jgi:hypothetical protein
VLQGSSGTAPEHKEFHRPRTARQHGGLCYTAEQDRAAQHRTVWHACMCHSAGSPAALVYILPLTHNTRLLLSDATFASKAPHLPDLILSHGDETQAKVRTILDRCKRTSHSEDTVSARTQAGEQQPRTNTMSCSSHGYAAAGTPQQKHATY